MVGRAIAKKKRFFIGIQAMEYTHEDKPEYELQIISNLTGINHLQNLVSHLNLDNNVKFKGYFSSPEVFFQKACLNLFPSITEAFPLALSESKIYGIPNILLGLDYIAISKGGSIIIYDDLPESLAKQILKLIKNKNYLKKLGSEAKKSMFKFDNELITEKWTKLLLSIYYGDNYYIDILKEDKKISDNEAKRIINNQIKMLKMRDSFFYNITLDNFENYSFFENLK